MNVQDIIDYENGDMDWDRIVDMFQKLIDNGQAWTLQGSYGRMAQRLIDAGECFLPNEESPQGED